MYDILCLNKISNKIYDVLTDEYAVSDKTESPDAILVRSFKMDEYEINDNLLCVGRAGAGVNNIPLDRMTDAGVCVFNTPGANANAVKELVICGMFLASRDIIGGNQWANTLTGADVPKQVEKGKSNFGGTEILGKTVGIVGLGAIGIKVATALNALGMKVVGYDPFYKGNADFINVVNTLEEIYAVSDYISLHLPLLPTTRGMINEDAIAKMKDGVIILNMARGELVDVSAVKTALENGKIRNYVVDFPSEDCLNVKGIIAIPHLGASTEEAEENCAIMASAQIKEYLENGNIVNSVNFPNIKVEKEKDNRLTVIYNAGTKALDEIKNAISGIDATFNYAERGTVGYAIIDTDNTISLEADENLISTIADLDDVVGIRIL
ncbi:MAG: 3-phosphoglycerate dehydrogenase [Clostridia bacterium]|nr:3-phosphoglycerate dehydrogenase [Clostridia bacterium]